MVFTSRFLRAKMHSSAPSRQWECLFCIQVFCCFGDWQCKCHNNTIDFKWTLATSGDNLGKTTLKTQKEGGQNPSSQNQNWQIIDGGIYARNRCDGRWTVTVFVLYILLHSCTLGSHYTVGSSLCLHELLCLENCKGPVLRKIHSTTVFQQ